MPLTRELTVQGTVTRDIGTQGTGPRGTGPSVDRTCRLLFPVNPVFVDPVFAPPLSGGD